MLIELAVLNLAVMGLLAVLPRRGEAKVRNGRRLAKEALRSANARLDSDERLLHPAAEVLSGMRSWTEQAWPGGLGGVAVRGALAVPALAAALLLAGDGERRPAAPAVEAEGPTACEAELREALGRLHRALDELPAAHAAPRVPSMRVLLQT